MTLNKNKKKKPDNDLLINLFLLYLFVEVCLYFTRQYRRKRKKAAMGVKGSGKDLESDSNSDCPRNYCTIFQSIYPKSMALT